MDGKVLQYNNKILKSDGKVGVLPPPIVSKGTMIDLDISGNDKATYRVLKCFGNEALVLRMSLAPSIFSTTKYCADETHTININGINTLNYNGSDLDIELENYYNLLTSDAKTAIISMPIIQDVWITDENNYDICISGNNYKKIGENYIGNRYISPLSLTQLIEYFDFTQNIQLSDFRIATANITKISDYSSSTGYLGTNTWISTSSGNYMFCTHASYGMGRPCIAADNYARYPTIVFTIDLSKINYTINTTPVGTFIY